MNRLPLQWRGVFLALLGVRSRLCHASHPGFEASAVASAASVSLSPDVCESKTINYITHTLPQQCLRTSWTSPAPSADGAATEGTVTISLKPAATPQDEPSGLDNATEKKAADGQTPEPPARENEEDGEESEELATSSFMSFEEWKEMMLRKSGQDPESIKNQKQREHRERDPSLAHADIDSIGDDGEISLDFDVLSDKVSEMATPPSGPAGTPSSGKELREEGVMYVDGTYRSKDAGKTCKERFSFSSFDAGATILKTSPGAKSANSILVENKDSYMLLECQTKNKFVIIELSDDILIDTVVLANYEFFSSMIRRFRISVSARYPVKLDKWVDLGTFEARNSRDIQAFLIPHPQIYSKYIRVEFLSHYGTEYYCPVSLLRVHGTRMLDTWKEPDNSAEDELEETIDAPQEQIVVGEKPDVVVAEEPVAASAKGDPIQSRYVGEVGLSPWHPMFEAALSQETCMISSPTTSTSTPMSSHIHSYNNSSISASPVIGPAEMSKSAVPTDAPEPRSSRPSTPSAESQASPSNSNVSTTASSGPSVVPKAGNGTAPSGTSHHRPSSGRTNATDAHPSASSKITSASSTTNRNKTSTAASAVSASPTVQESFFKAVTKRLQNLESNTSLSLQYIEDQSRFLQDALRKMEKKQISRVDAFLDNLNRTVLTELRNVRTQYDQIWQSTVLALETQREQNQREIVALSSRLNILADEVVFQKRMAILQSVLLLSCLVLVIFSRGFVPTPLDLGMNPQASMSAPALMSPLSPRGFFSRNRVEDSPPPGRPSAVARMSSGRHPLARSFSYNDKVLPLTPTSDFSREGTPIIQVEDVEVPFFDEVGRESYDAMTPPHSNRAENGMAPDSDSMESTPEAMADGPQHVSPPETEPVQPLLRHSHSAMSQLGGGVARKPLPALPEDPS